MTDQEVQEKIDAMKTEISSALTKQYEEKTESAIASAKAEAKAEAEAEKKVLADRIALLEKQSRDESEKARTVTINSRLESLVKDGKVMPAERAKLKAVFSAIPDAILHTYSDAEGKEVKEPVDETLWKIFESRKSSIFKEVALSRGGKNSATSDDGDGNPQARVVKLAKEYAASDKDLGMRGAYAKVAEEHPDLWQEYQGEVKGSH